MSFTKRDFKYLKIGLIQPKLFVLVKSTDIYILSGKYVSNRSISMEVRSNTLTDIIILDKRFSAKKVYIMILDQRFSARNIYIIIFYQRFLVKNIYIVILTSNFW